MTGEISLAVIDDHPLFREGVIRSLLEIGGFVILGDGGTRDDAVRITETLRPDVVLLDISMPGGGVEAIELILDRIPDQKIIMLTVSETADDVTRALNHGAKGYALKGVGSRTLAEVIHIVASGETYVAPTLAARIISGAPAASDKASRIAQLTIREREVLEFVTQGLSNKHIALKLDLHEKTIKHHMTQIMAKLGVSNRTEAALVSRDVIDRLPIQ